MASLNRKTYRANISASSRLSSPLNTDPKNIRQYSTFKKGERCKSALFFRGLFLWLVIFVPVSESRAQNSAHRSRSAVPIKRSHRSLRGLNSTAPSPVNGERLRIQIGGCPVRARADTCLGLLEERFVHNSDFIPPFQYAIFLREGARCGFIGGGRKPRNIRRYSDPTPALLTRRIRDMTTTPCRPTESADPSLSPALLHCRSAEFHNMLKSMEPQDEAHSFGRRSVICRFRAYNLLGDMAT